MAQNWNGLLGYIKRNMGAKLNFLEMTDEEIIEGLRDDVFPFFSQYSPQQKYTYIDGYSDGATVIKPGQNRYTYIMKNLEKDEQIIDIYDVYYQSQADTVIFDDFAANIMSSFNMMDIAMANQYVDAAKYLMVRNTWEFMTPNIITFDLAIRNAVVVYNTPHTDPSTVRPDYYETILKKLCLGNVQKWVSALRSKYENISTPFGFYKKLLYTVMYIE